MAKGKSRRCGSCGHTWDPKGKTQSKCPHCNSTDLRFVIGKDPASEAPKKPSGQAGPPTAIPPVFGEWNDTPSFGRAPTPSFGSAPSGAGASRSRRSRAPEDEEKRSVVTLLLLFLVVVGVLGGLILLKTGGKLPAFLRAEQPPPRRPAARRVRPRPRSAGCRKIEKRYRYARRMARKAPKKWKRWVAHWAERADASRCQFKRPAP